MDYNKEDLLYYYILFLFAQSKKEEWNQYRNKAIEKNESVIQELEQYFENIFKDNIPQYKLSIKTSLYRARQIKSNELNEIGVNFECLKDDYLKIFLTANDIKEVEKSNSLFTYETSYFCRNFLQKELDENQLNKLHKFNKEYSDTNCFYGFKKSYCGVPPLNHRQNGRLSEIEDAYLYLALEKNTAIYEMRPSNSCLYSLAKWEPNKELLLVDLRSVREINSDNFIAASLSEKVSEPNTYNDDKFYHITQCLSHFLQKKNYDGIIYTSAIKKNGTNVMLFDEKNAKAVSSEIVSINNIHVDYTTLLPLKKNDTEDVNSDKN